MKKIYTIHRVALVMLFAACLQGIKAQSIYLVDVSRTSNTASTAVTTVNAAAWGNATGFLQAALDAATASGGQVWVKQGTYYPTAFPNGCTGCNEERDKAFFLRNNVAIYGGFAGTETMLSQRNVSANATILSGDVNTRNNSTDNSYHVVISVGNNRTAILDGFIIAAANANGYGSRNIMGQNVGQGVGGGVYSASSSPTINNCSFAANNSSGSGGGMYNLSGSPLVSNCSFSANNSYGDGSNNSSKDGGGIANESSSPVISGSRFVSNYAASNGGAISNTNSSATISNCSFIGNNSYSGGGISNLSSSATITNSSFSTNYSTHGGGINNSFSSSVAITNCVFNANTSGEGGAIYNSSCSPVITNSTFFTVSDGNPWAFYNSNANPTITNSIIFSSNSGSGISNQNSAPTITYSIVKGGYAGTGNQNTDPLFVNAGSPAGSDGVFGTADDGLALQCGSSAINAGNTAAVPSGTTTDITNAPRIQNSSVDVGAYEYQGAPGTVSLATTGDAATYTVSTGVTTQFVTGCRLIGSLLPTGANPASGNATGRVWIEPTQPNYNGQTYVKRHFQFTTVNNPTTSTARITLYATQQEFDDFTNYGTNTNLPLGPNDMAGIARLRIFKYSGQSSDGSGTPGSYPQPGIEINPDDNDIVYNNALGRWEITFNVTGFSGFFIGNAGISILPLSLLNFDGKMSATNSVSLNWRTSNEVNTAYFDLQRSSDGRSYTTISTLQATGTPQSENSYSYNDKNLQPGLYYYRLRMVDKDGKEKYSQVVVITFKSKGAFAIYPVPAKDVAWISGNDLNLVGKNLQLTDVQGRVLNVVRISQWPQKLDVSSLAKGNYFVKLPDNTILRLVKD